MDIIEEAARIGGFHDDLTVCPPPIFSTAIKAGDEVRQVSIAIFDDAAFIDKAIAAGALQDNWCVLVTDTIRTEFAAARKA